MENIDFFVKNYPGGFFSYKADGKGEFVFVSNFLLRMLGYTSDEFKAVTGNTFSGMIYPADRAGVLKKISEEAPLEGANAYDSCSYRVKKKDGTIIWLHDEGHLVHLNDQEAVYFVVVVDITDYKRVLASQNSLISCIKSLSNENDLDNQMKSVLESVYQYYKGDRCVVYSLSPDGKTMTNTYERCAENVAPAIDGLKDVSTKDFGPVLSCLSRQEYLLVNQEELELDPGRKYEQDFLAGYGITTVLMVPIKMSGRLVGFIGVDNPSDNIENHSFLQNIAFFVYDALQRHELHEELINISLRDELTGLPNRYCYDQLLEKLQGETTKNIGVVFADLNGLKYINDHFGHHYGDQYLQNFAKSPTDVFGKPNVFRISGDEFVVILVGIAKEDFDERIKALEDDFLIKGFEIASYGSVYHQRSSDVLGMIREAEAIMYAKKKVFHASRASIREEDKEEYYRKRFPFLAS